MGEVKKPMLDDLSAQIVAEHEQIREAAARLKQSTDLSQLLTSLEAFRALLAPHFLTEGEPGGFFDMVRSHASRHFDSLAELEGEHWAMLQDIDRVAAKAREVLAGPVAAVIQQAVALTAKLERHEARENDLFLDALYTEIGDD